MASYILGTKFLGHDTNAAIVDPEGRVVACVEQERLDRIKHSSAFPEMAINCVLKMAGIGPEDVGVVAVAFAHELYVARAPHMERYFRENKSFDPAHRQRLLAYEWRQALEHLIGLAYLKRLFPNARIVEVPHHLCHVAAAFYCSPFEEAAVLSVDAAGEIDTTLLAHAGPNGIRQLESVPLPHSLGFVYEYVSEWLGLGRLEGPGKTMGLASYGTPRFYELFARKLMIIDEPGTLMRIHPGFVSEQPPPLFNTAYLEELLGRSGRMEDTEVFDQFQADVAASVQLLTEEALLKLVGRLKQLTGSPRLCMAGGIALNCVANARVLTEGGFEELFIHPASNDGGSGLGAALYAYHQILNPPQGQRQPFHPYLGPAPTTQQVLQALEQARLPIRRLGDPATWTAQQLAQGRLVAWARGGAELGPRALGNRSIFADPRKKENKDALNARVKHREWWRPFAPVAPAEEAHEYFDIQVESPYMLLVCKVKDDRIPAVTHVDHTARLQTVRAQQHPELYRLVKAFGELTGVAVILNTSFNIRGEPLITTAEEALNCLYRGGLDAIVVDDFLVTREDLDPSIHRPRDIVHHEPDAAFQEFRKKLLKQLEAQAPNAGSIIEGTGIHQRLLALSRLLSGLRVQKFMPGAGELQDPGKELFGLPVEAEQ